MTFAYECPGCAYKFEQGYKANPLPDRPDAVTPMRSTDRDMAVNCPNCGTETTADEGATLRLGGATYHDTPLSWCEKNLPQARAIDTGSTGRSDSRRRGVGVNRVMVGLPGKHGGFSKAEH